MEKFLRIERIMSHVLLAIIILGFLPFALERTFFSEAQLQHLGGHFYPWWMVAVNFVFLYFLLVSAFLIIREVIVQTIKGIYGLRENKETQKGFTINGYKTSSIGKMSNVTTFMCREQV
ncbi:hypothetical protein [Tenuibacillus multivorans]|uniref:Uncharacterized protein n=1 Tax=Tenuibacillus multivorans TaxID=237069 RepID=A0A1G9YCH3_9BACI|nr:hypothetical protein [Tenuibacillus multivorans]GEL76026.1 hypothetical protein TMU01_02610 [Tenuibacillus multivorans]SDN06356.1 hypothetical protein SAMN05216498_1322 [Tenuibacillus multivorans]